MILSCLEFIQPHPDQAVHQLVERGHNQVVVMPYLLGQGKHATLEMDEALDELRNELPDLELVLSGGFGADLRLADLVVERVRELESANPHLTNGTGAAGVMVVKAGTNRRPSGRMGLSRLSR